jgi:hypothetical protein
MPWLPTQPTTNTTDDMAVNTTYHDYSYYYRQIIIFFNRANPDDAIELKHYCSKCSELVIF